MKSFSSVKKFVRDKAKSSLFKALGNSYLIKKRIHYLSINKYLTILNLHKISEDDSSCYKPLNPEIFKELIVFLKKNYYITSFLEIQNNKSIDLVEPNKPKVILSFDDGYKDFIEVVHPILMNEGIRANHNIIPKCVETGNPPLNVALNDFLGKSNKKEWEKLKLPGYTLNRERSKIEEGIRLSNFIKNRSNKSQKEIEKIIRNQIGEKLDQLSTKMMTKADILKIFEFYDWGAHSFEHSNMGLESDYFFINDLKKCKSWFINNFNFDPNIYAFPNGSFHNGQIEIAKKLGFAKTLLVGENYSYIENNSHFRFGFDAISNSEMKVKATGMHRKLFVK